MYGPKWPFLLMYISSDVDDYDRWFLGRAPRTRETLPDLRESCRVTQHSRVFCGLTVVNGPPGNGASQLGIRAKVNDYLGSSVGVELR